MKKSKLALRVERLPAWAQVEWARRQRTHNRMAYDLKMTGFTIDRLRTEVDKLRDGLDIAMRANALLAEQLTKDK